MIFSRGGSDCVQIIVKIVHRDTLQFNDPPSQPPMRDDRNVMTNGDFLIVPNQLAQPARYTFLAGSFTPTTRSSHRIRLKLE